MRGYLERIAAAAIVPGGSFHPILGSIHGRRAETSSASGDVPWGAAAPGEQPLRMALNKESPGPMPGLDGEAERVAEHVPLVSSVVRGPTSGTALARQFPRAPQPGILRDSSGEEIAHGDSGPDAEMEVSSSLGDSVKEAGILAAKQSAGEGQGARWRAERETEPGVPSAVFPRRAEVAGGVGADALPAHSALKTTKSDLSFVERAPDASADFVVGETSPMLSSASRVSPRVQSTSASGFGVAAIASPRASAQQAGSGPLAYLPLVARKIPASAGANDNPSAFQARPQPRVSRPSSPRERVSAREQTQQREPDEIQIHIGRIEVTAVAPAPAAHTQPTAGRRTPSLDDYLRRGNGRA